jgi:aminoglycoside 2''-phosphotransferase
VEVPTRYLNAIEGAYPNLRVASARLLAASEQANDVVCVNDAIVLRFPRSARSLQRIPAMLAVLRALQGRTMIPTPRPIYRSREMRIEGEAFVGYPMLPGEPMQTESLATMGDETARGLAEQLAQFLSELHSVPRDMVDVPLGSSLGVDHWRRLFSHVQERLLPEMTPEARDAAVAHFHTLIEEPSASDHRGALVHGDFRPDNVLWDPASGEVTGVVDFDSVGWNDPAIDVASAWRFGARFAEHLAGAYPGVEKMKRRADAYREALALQDALGTAAFAY